MIGLQPLPFQDRSFPDESTRGYALRMAERNGLRGLVQVAQAIGVRTLDFADMNAISAVARLFGAEPEQLWNMGPTSTDRDGERRFMFMGHNVLRDWLFRLHRPQLCPRCLGDDAYIRSDWELLLVTSCRTHGTLLIDRCQTCRRTLTWSRPSLSRCRCGSDLRRQLAPPCPDQGATLWICRRLDLLRRTAVPSTTEHDVVAALSLDGLMRAVWGLGIKTQDDAPIPPGHVRRPFSTAEINEISSRGRARLEALIELAVLGDSPTPAGVHPPVFLSLARDGDTLCDRLLATQIVLGARTRAWATARLRDAHPGSQMTLF